jgi:hypothetical protein
MTTQLDNLVGLSTTLQQHYRDVESAAWRALATPARQQHVDELWDLVPASSSAVDEGRGLSSFCDTAEHCEHMPSTSTSEHSAADEGQGDPDWPVGSGVRGQGGVGACRSPTPANAFNTHQLSAGLPKLASSTSKRVARRIALQDKRTKRAVGSSFHPAVVAHMLRALCEDCTAENPLRFHVQAGASMLSSSKAAVAWISQAAKTCGLACKTIHRREHAAGIFLEVQRTGEASELQEHAICALQAMVASALAPIAGPRKTFSGKLSRTAKAAERQRRQGSSEDTRRDMAGAVMFVSAGLIVGEQGVEEGVGATIVMPRISEPWQPSQAHLHTIPTCAALYQDVAPPARSTMMNGALQVGTQQQLTKARGMKQALAAISSEQDSKCQAGGVSDLGPHPTKPPDLIDKPSSSWYDRARIDSAENVAAEHSLVREDEEGHLGVIHHVRTDDMSATGVCCASTDVLGDLNAPLFDAGVPGFVLGQHMQGEPRSAQHTYSKVQHPPISYAVLHLTCFVGGMQSVTGRHGAHKPSLKCAGMHVWLAPGG